MYKDNSDSQWEKTDALITHIQKHRKGLGRNFRNSINQRRELTYKILSKNKYPLPNLLTLFTPYPNHSCRVAESPKKYSVVGRHNTQVLYVANTDFWNVIVKRDKNRQSNERITFQIGVKVGPHSFFHPKLIKERICDWFDIQTYNIWREIIKADLKNLAPYISAFNPPCNISSVVCGDSSASVCTSIGIPVKHGNAYWLRQDKEVFSPQFKPDTVQGTSVTGLNYADIAHCPMITFSAFDNIIKYASEEYLLAIPRYLSLQNPDIDSQIASISLAA